MKWMRNYVGDDVPLFSIIAFSERCELKQVTVESPDVKVIKRDLTYATVRGIWDKKPDVISDEKIEELYLKLKELTNVDQAVKLAHIENIEKKYKNKEEEKVEPQVIETATAEEVTEEKETKAVEEQKIPEDVKQLLCPKCGSPLVLRTAKKGGNS